MSIEALQNIPENVPLRESSPDINPEIPNKSADAPNLNKPRFRESSESGKAVPPRKPKKSERRSREYLTSDEATKLQTAAGRIGSHGHRDATIILLGYRHGLRVSELVA